MFDRFLNSIIQDENTKMYIGVGIVIYIACLTDMVPNQFKKLLKEPIVKMIVLSSIAYLSTINFEGALMLTIVYFATANCMSYENFSNILVEDTTNDTASVKNMKDAIKNYPDDRTINEINRENLNRWGMAATDTLPAGQCYKNTVDNVTEEVVNRSWEESLNWFNRVSGNEETTTTTTAETVSERCGHTDLNQVVKCAKDTDNTDPFSNQQFTFPACGAAHGKYLKRVCKIEGDNGNCVDDSGAVICSGGPGNCNDDDLEDHTKFELRNLTATDNTNFDNIDLDTIKTRYLKNLDDPSGRIDSAIAPVRTTIKTKIVSGEEVPLHNVSQGLFVQITDLNDPTLNKINESGDKPKYKLNSGYVYLYKLANNTVPTSDQTVEVKDLPEDYIEIYVSEIGKLTEASTHIELEDAINDKNKYFALDVNGNFTYDPRRNPEFGTEGNTNEFLKEDGNQTNELTEAANAHHPKFKDKAYNYEQTVAKYDIYDRVNPRGFTYAKTTNVNTFMEKYNTIYSDNSNPNEEQITEYTSYLRGNGEESDPGFVKNLLSDLVELNKWEANKLNAKNKWENETAQKIMRSIGCHRLRDSNTQSYGYWDSSTNKCEFELIPTQST
tara:strand:+ start:587 stop:2422 length:1836 start_codon:yes stop_codon:yes gene_type:complete